MAWGIALPQAGMVIPRFQSALPAWGLAIPAWGSAKVAAGMAIPAWGIAIPHSKFVKLDPLFANQGFRFQD